MSCCGRREKEGELRAEQKWDYINLSDFRSSSCAAPLSYGYLFIMLLVSISVYVVDIFTAANLLFFDRWSGQVQPKIPFEISRWIFTGCILLSLILLVFRWLRATRAIKTGSIAASYLDPLALRIQSVRTGKNGRGWRRFLVFAALTEGRKGTEYVALFTYFSFEAWLRIVFADGPRKVINAVTLYSVMNANLLPKGDHAANAGHSPFVQFWINVQILSDKNREQAAILFGMLFTLVIWVISVLSLLMAVLFYITYLWHHIPHDDGSLSAYCRRKIDTRLHKIVEKKVQKALAKEEKLLAKRQAKANASGENLPPMKRQPTIPLMPGDVNDQSSISSLSRQTTQTSFGMVSEQPTIPPIEPSSHLGSVSSMQRQPTVPSMSPFPTRPQAPSRATTQSSMRSDMSYASNAPLLSGAMDMGYGPPGSVHRGPSVQRKDSQPGFTGNRPPPSRSFTGDSYQSHQTFKTAPSRAGSTPPTLMTARPTMPNSTLNSYGRRIPAAEDDYPAPSQEYELQSRNGGYVAFNPNVHTPDSNAPRNFTLPNPTLQSATPPRPPPQRSGTAPLPETPSYVPYHPPTYPPSAETMAGPPMPVRPATSAPRGTVWNGQRRPMPPPY